MRSMRPGTIVVSAFVVLSLCLVSGCRTPKGASIQAKQNYALQMKQDTLAELYRKHPEARARIQKAAGYAVFNLVSSKIFLLATGNGFGVATDNRTGKNTFMKMIEAGGGVGMGLKTYKSVYVFNDRAAFEAFTRGAWQAGGDADAGAKYGETDVSAGTALTTDELTRPVTVYQFTDKGVSVAAVATGTRFYRDEELN